MRPHRLALVAALTLAGCTRPTDAPAPPVEHEAPSFDAAVAVHKQEKPVVDQAIHLQLPSGLSPEVYQRLRKDPTLGPALDREMIPALEQAGSPADRLAAFAKARDAALAGWKPTLDADQAASKATGPMTPPTRTAFDQVSTDVLRGWFIQVAEAVAAAGPRDAAIATIKELEPQAQAAFPWDASAAQSVAVRIRLVRAQLEESTH